MSFSNPAFIVQLLTGTIFIVAGMIMLKWPPKKINWIYGYRTMSSMKSQDRWDLAQRYSAKEMIRFGTIQLLISLISLFFNPNEGIGVVMGLGLFITFTIVLIVKTERAIKEKFSS